jgi:hypothetical protein
MSIDISDAARLAAYFSALVRAELSPVELAEVRRRNASPDYAAACATHDFRDANALMFGAYAALAFEAPDPADESTADIMNQAWDLARARGFAE